MELGIVDVFLREEEFYAYEKQQADLLTQRPSQAETVSSTPGEPRLDLRYHKRTGRAGEDQK
jgi:hypothetical protein